MKDIKGFINIDSLVDNTVSIVAPYGELSAYSRSYTKDRGTYTSTSNTGVEAVVFSAVDNDTTEDITISETQIDHLLVVAEWVALNIKDSSFGSTKNEVITSLRDYFYPSGVSYLDIGELLLNDSVYAPSFVVWEKDDVRYTMWFSDASFKADYPHFIIDVIAPVDSVDDLLRPFTELSPLLKSPMVITQEANASKGSTVTTAFLMQEHIVYEHNASENELLSYWGINLYGEEAFSVDEQKSAIRSYVLANSTYDMFVWALVLPSIFVPNELYVIPCWDKISVVTQTLYGGMYAPTLSMAELDRLSQKFAFGYEPAHITAHAEHTPLLYKSLGTVTIGAETNIEDKFKVSELHPTYALIHANHLDFNRIAPETQEFIKWLYSAVIIAENYSDATILQGGMSIVKRGTYEYLTDSIDGLTVLVLTKGSYMTAEGHDWEPADNQYYTPGEVIEQGEGIISIGDTYVSNTSKLSLSGATSRVPPGATVTIDVVDSDNKIISFTDTVNDTYTYMAVDLDISSLVPGILEVTVKVIDDYSEVVQATENVGYVIATGAFTGTVASYLQDGYDAVKNVYTTFNLGIAGELVNCEPDASIYYRFEDKNSNVREGYIRAVDSAFNDQSIPFDSPYRLTNGPLSIELRTTDVTGQIISWSDNIDSSIAAGTIDLANYDDEAGTIIINTRGTPNDAFVTLEVTDEASTTWSDEFRLTDDTAGGGTITAGPLPLRLELQAGDISFVAKVLDYNGNEITSDVLEATLVSATPEFSDLSVGWYDGWTETSGAGGDDGQSNFVIHGNVLNAPANGIMTVEVHGDTLGENTYTSFNLTVANGSFSIDEINSGAYPDFWYEVTDANYPFGDTVKIDLTYTDYTGSMFTKRVILGSMEGTHVHDVQIVADTDNSGLLTVSGGIRDQLHGSQVKVTLNMGAHTLEGSVWSYQPEESWTIAAPFEAGNVDLRIPSGSYTATIEFSDITTGRRLQTTVPFEYVTPLSEEELEGPEPTGPNGVTQILAGDTFGIYSYYGSTYGTQIAGVFKPEETTTTSLYTTLGKDDAFSIPTFIDASGTEQEFLIFVTNVDGEYSGRTEFAITNATADYDDPNSVADNDTTWKTLTVDDGSGDVIVLTRADANYTTMAEWAGTPYRKWRFRDIEVPGLSDYIVDAKYAGRDITLTVEW